MMLVPLLCLFFFFQAEDGIRDPLVTGVQTCALPICVPRLRIAFAHGGGAFPGTLGRIERGFQARPDLVAVDNPHPPSRYLKRIYVDSLVHDASALRFVLDVFAPERVALGSDYPFPLGEERPGALIESLDLSADVRERLRSGTALEWLGRRAGAY